MAETQYPVTIVLRADGKGLQGTLKLTAREARQLERSLDEVGGSAKRSAQQMDGAARQADKFGARAQAGANRARDSMGRYVGVQDQAAEATGRLSRLTGTMGERFKAAGRTLSLYLTAGLIAAAGASVKFTTDFESELTRINTLVGVGRDEIAEYRDQILELGPAVGRGPAELAQGLFAVTSAGARGAQAMETLTAAAQASAIGLGSTRDIALAATSAVTAYGEANLSSKEAVEILIGTVEQGNLEASELAGSLGRVISIAAQAGVSFRDAGAFIAAFTRQGVSANEAVTGLRGVLATLVREPTSDAIAAFERMGTSAAEFKQRIADQGFIVAFQDLVNRARASGVEISALVPEVEALAGAMAVFASEGQSAADIADQVGNAVGTLESRLQAAREQDPALAFSMMRAELETLGVEIGSNLLPVVLDLVEMIREASAWFRELDPQTQSLAIKFAAVAAAAGPVLLVLGSITKTVATLAPLLLTAARAMGPIGILVSVLGSLALTTQGIPALMESARAETAGFGEASETTAEKVARLTGNIDELRRSKIKETFEELQQEAFAMRNEILALDQEIEQALSGEFLDGAAIEMQAQRERMVAQYREVIDHLHELNDAYEQVGQGAADAGEEIATAGNKAGDATEKFDKSLSGLVDLIDEARGRADFYAQSMISIAEALFQAATGMERFNREANKNTRRGDPQGLPFGLEGVMEELEDIYDQMSEIAAIEWNFENLIDSFHPLAGQMRRLQDDIALIDEALNRTLISEAEAGFFRVGATANAAFDAMKAGVDRSSQEYQELELAQQALNVALGIAAILQQGMGDPYTAIPRMIAMAAMVAQLVDGVDSLSGGGGSAASRQEVQGTGSVLGDPSAKSESIANATQITADATSELVGISRAQLRALQRLQDGIAGAAGLVARGAGDLDLSGVNVGMSGLEASFKKLDPLGYAIDSFVGGLFGFGKTKVTDQGIALLGGAITDMTEGAVAQAYGDLKRKSLFGSKRKTVMEDLDEAFNDQLNLIFESMIDTVTAAGEALGIPLDQIQARIDQFQIEAQEISLKDLSAEEQKAELEAVFSRIFDDLATEVIPFLGQFQRVGEGMGETMVRVATSVQVTEEAVHRLGLSIGELDPEHMAQVSVGLVEAAGGIEQFITKMESFVDKFAPEAHQFEIAQSDLTRALDQLGLSVPATRQGMWELMQSLDATTESGRRQIATLLELTDAADAFYSGLEAIQQEREGLEQRLLQLQGDTAALRAIELEALDESNRALQQRIWALEDEQALQEIMGQVLADMRGMEWSPLRQELYRITQATLDATAAVRARGGSEEDYALIQRRYTMQTQALAGELRASLTDMRDQLFGGGNSISSSMQSTASSISSSMDQIQTSMIDAIKGVQEWLDSSLLDNNSPLVPQEQLEAAGSQFWEAIDAARNNDAEAARALPQLADQFLSQAGQWWGTSTAEYRDIWQMVRDAMQGVADMDVADENRPPTYGQQQSIVDATQSTQMTALEQARLAGRMVDELGVLARISGDSPADIAEELGIPIGKLMAAVTGDMPAATGEALRAEFNDFIEDADAQLSTLGRIEGLLTDIRDGLPTVVTVGNLGEIGYGRGLEPKDPPAGKGSGDWSTGIVVPIDIGPDPVASRNAFGHSNSDPKVLEALRKIEQRMARLEALTESGNELQIQQVRAIDENTAATTAPLSDLVRINNEQLNKPAPRGRLGE